jgi:hypothetical protein
MDLYRLGIKFFAETGRPVELTEFIPVFHEWIQKQIIAEHLLIDVHNYSHMQDGPGILLVAHQGNFSIDMMEGRMGLLYYRKQPIEALSDIIKPAVQACGLLEQDTRMRDRLRFRMKDMLIIANDRLLAPNNDETVAELQPPISAALKEVLAKSFQLSRVSDDPKERLTMRAQLLTQEVHHPQTD